jgi:hypothetical protein
MYKSLFIFHIPPFFILNDSNLLDYIKYIYPKIRVYDLNLRHFSVNNYFNQKFNKHLILSSEFRKTYNIQPE